MMNGKMPFRACWEGGGRVVSEDVFSATDVCLPPQVPVDTDLQEIIKEISIMQQCDSPFIVKYYGSYFKNTDLWVRVCVRVCVCVSTCVGVA